MGSSALVADPFLWALLTALAFGLAAGQGLRAFLPLPMGGAAFLQKRSARVARSIAVLALSCLDFACLLIFADKASLASELSSGAAVPLLPWACAAAILGLLAGFRPFVLGLPLLGLSLLALGFLSLCLQGWLPNRASEGGSFAVAHLLPYSVASTGFRGQLELPERDSVPVAQDLSLSTTSVSLRVESLALAGPLRFAASIVSLGKVPSGVISPRPSDPSTADAEAGPRFSSVLRYYRVVGIVSPDGRSSLVFSRPRHAALLDAVIGLGLGPDPSASALFGLASRSARSSSPVQLFALEPVDFFLSADGSELEARPEN